MVFYVPPTQYRSYAMGYGFYRSKDPTNSIKVLKEKAIKGKTRKRKQQNIHTQQYTLKRYITYIKHNKSPSLN